MEVAWMGWMESGSIVWYDGGIVLCISQERHLLIGEQNRLCEEKSFLFAVTLAYLHISGMVLAKSIMEI